MPLYFLKPVVWNSKHYRQPSGDKVRSGYPKKFGFGHEEWNNADNSVVVEGGVRKRVFHIQDFGNQPIEDHAGEIYVFMIASHDGGQYLVGIAGGASSLFSKEHAQARSKYASAIGRTSKRRDQTWDLPQVQKLFNYDERAFDRHWKKTMASPANWICPAELFYWLDEPMLLDPMAISGKSSLVKMFGSYQGIAREMAARIAGQVQPPWPNAELDNIKARLESDAADVTADINAIESDPKLKDKPTVRQRLVQARLGQGKFRRDLLSIWGGECAVTGCDVEQALRASHIKPWRDSSNNDRLDPENGLLLAATLDALFDKGLVSFADSGAMIVSETIAKAQRAKLGIPAKLRRKPSPKQCRFLAKHRELFNL